MTRAKPVMVDVERRFAGRAVQALRGLLRENVHVPGFGMREYVSLDAAVAVVRSLARKPATKWKAKR